MDNEIIWQAEEHHHTSKSADWFWVLGIAAVSASVISILFHNFFFALLVLVAAFTLALLARRTPNLVQFKINSQGFFVGTEQYAWDTVQAFYIKSEDSPPKLLINTRKILAPHLLVPLPTHKIEGVRTLLAKYTKEEDLAEPVTHKVSEFLGL